MIKFLFLISRKWGQACVIVIIFPIQYNSKKAVDNDNNASLAPTWRANPERISHSVFNRHQNINISCVNFLHNIRNSYTGYSQSIFIGGMMGCKGDAYNPAQALSKQAAKKFHQKQADELAKSKVDFIKAATLPALSEALGMAQAMSQTRVPYILSFVINPDGTILDGTSLSRAIETIDKDVTPAPVFYMVNCVHPKIFDQAVSAQIRQSENTMRRIKGFQANTSLKSPEELDNLSYLDTSDPEEFADLMIMLHHKFKLKILGGCCGSDASHINKMAGKLTPSCARPDRQSFKFLKRNIS